MQAEQRGGDRYLVTGAGMSKTFDLHFPEGHEDVADKTKETDDKAEVDWDHGVRPRQKKQRSAGTGDPSGKPRKPGPAAPPLLLFGEPSKDAFGDLLHDALKELENDIDNGVEDSDDDSTADGTGDEPEPKSEPKPKPKPKPVDTEPDEEIEPLSAGNCLYRLHDVHDAKEVQRLMPAFRLNPDWSAIDLGGSEPRPLGRIRAVGESLIVECRIHGCKLFLRHRGRGIARAEATAFKWLIAGLVATEKRHCEDGKREHAHFQHGLE